MHASNREIKRRLRRLAHAITANVPMVNFGGCGCVAYIVGEHLQSFGLPVEVVTPVGYYNKPASVIRPWMNNVRDPREWDKNGLGRMHMVLRFKMGGRVYTWDSDGLIRSCWKCGGNTPFTTTHRFGDGLTVEETKGMCGRQKGWNRQFDRKTGIPTIKTLADYYLRLGL